MTPIPYLRAVTWGTVAVFMAIAALVAVAFPLHASDALTFGEWSRLIAERWSHIFDASNRPLFYALQGSLWHATGYSDTSGRLLCGLFSLVLVGSLAWLASARPWGRVTSVLVVLFVLATPVFAQQVVSSLTDVVVAALVALAGALAFWTTRQSLVQPISAGFAAMLAVLAKPSAILALIGLGAAQLLAPGTLRSRLVRRMLPLAAGTLTGFAYYVVETSRMHFGLRSYLEAGVTGPYYSHLAAVTRRSAILDSSWFGQLLRSVLIFTLLYALARVMGAGHRSTVVTVLPAVAVLSWLLPWIGARESHVEVGALTNPSSAVAWILSCAVLAAAFWAPEAALPTRREIAMFGLWALLPLVAWMTYATYDTRLLSPAWPGLLSLTAVCATPALAGCARIRPVALAPVTALVVAVALNVYNLDGLGRAGWDQWLRTPSSQRFNRHQTRAIVLPAISQALAILQPVVGSDSRLLTPEGSFRFYFPGRVDQTFPTSCGELAPYRAFILTTDQGSRTYMQDFLHVSGDPAYWAACKQPHLRELTSGANGLAVFVITQ